MADSITLLRRKIADTSLAVQDGTMNSVITLATIEVRLPHSGIHVRVIISQAFMLIYWDFLVWQRKL